MKTCPNIFVVGRRATGKTTLINHLLESRNVSKVEHTMQYPLDLQTLLEARKDLCEAQKLANVQEQWLVFDNTIVTLVDMTQNAFNNAMAFGKTLRMGTVVSLGYMYALPPQVTHTTDYVFMFRDDNAANVKRVYETYLQHITTFDSFYKAFSTATKDPYTCLVIDLTKAASGKEEDVLYTFKAVMVSQ